MWTFEENPISEGQGIIIVSSLGMLRVDNVKRKHSGKYECHGTTDQDEHFASMAHLIVVGQMSSNILNLELYCVTRGSTILYNVQTDTVMSRGRYSMKMSKYNSGYLRGRNIIFT